MITEKQDSPIQILNRYVLEATVNAMVGNSIKCSQIVTNALALSKESGVHLYDFMLIGHEISNVLNQNDVISARKLFKTLDNWQGPLRAWDKSFYHFLKARTALINKDYNEAYVHAEITKKTEDVIGSPLGISLSRMILAQIFHAQGKIEEAKALLEYVLELSEIYGSRTFALFVLFLKAQFALKEGEEAACAVLIKQAAGLAKDTGYVNTFVDQPEATADLCVFALENNIETEYFNYVVHVRQLVPSSPPIDLGKWPWPLKIYTFGQFRIDKEEKTLSFVGKVQQVPLRLLKLIITLGGICIPEEQLSDILWPEADGYSAHRAFSTALYRLRQLVEIPNLIQVSDGKVTIDKCMCFVDCWAFDKMATDMLPSINSKGMIFNLEKNMLKLEKAISYYRGDYLQLEDWGAPVISERERLRGLFVQLIEIMGMRLEEENSWQNAIQLYKRGLAIDEFVEKFYQRLMICYSSLGQKADALVIFDRCRKILFSAYGVEPNKKTNEIHLLVKNRMN